MKTVSRSTRQYLLVLCSAGSVLILTGFLLLSVFGKILSPIVQKNLALAEGKEAFEKWKTTPIPVFFSVFLFNITNPIEVEELGSKPIVQEVGPFVFSQMRSKKVIGWDDGNFTVTYEDLKRYNYLPNMSKDLELKVYSLNMPLMGIVQFSRKAKEFVKKILLPTFSGLFDSYKERLFVYRTARELIFEGYKVDMLQDLADVLKPFVDMPEMLPDNSFSFLYGKNNTGEGKFTVYTGVDDMTKYAKVVTWNDASRLSFWNDKYCGMINGTDGSQFAPPVTKYDILYVYTPEICRSVYLEFKEETEVRGIPTLRFGTPDRLFAIPKVNPDNQCYCINPALCDYYGLQDISPCKKGMPIVVGLPHFYLAHKVFAEAVDGLHPGPEHDNRVDIEPTTGLVMRASRKLQINFAMLEKYPEYKQTANLPFVVLPLLWIREEAELDAELAESFTAQVRTPITIAKSLLIACIVLGLLWILTAGCITVGIIWKKQKRVSTKEYKSVPQKPEENGKGKTEEHGSINL